FMRLLSTSGASTGMASVSTVATAATAASSAVSCLTPMLCIESISVQSIGCCSKVEVDHLLHHEDADAHPHGASRHHEAAELRRPKQLDVIRAGEPDQRPDTDRQRADDRSRCLGFHRHGLDLGLHL